MKKTLRDAGSLKGRYTIKVTDSKTGEVLQTLENENLIVRSTGYGYDLITRALGGDSTYQLEIDSASIGTGNTAPAASDMALVASVLSGIDLVTAEYPTSGQVLLSFFITDGQLANGTYKEFGIFSNGRLFARSLISPNLVKGSNQNITVEYTLTFS